MINIEWITAPVIGGVIGLITNGIAIKMLFRPLRPVKIGKFTLPFTPGLIPKERPRIAHAIGQVVGAYLLDTDTLQKALASDSLHEAFDQRVDELIENLGKEEGTADTLLEQKGYKMAVDTAENRAAASVSAYVTNSILEQKIADVMLEEAIQHVLSNLNSMIAMMAEPAIRKSQDSIAQKLNDVIAEKCPGIIEGYLDKEYQNWMNKPVKEAAPLLWQNKETIKEKVWGFYEELLEKQSAKFIEQLNVGGIVEEKINEFDLLELEKIILGICSKELNALVWIGGILGAAIGMVNLLF